MIYHLGYPIFNCVDIWSDAIFKHWCCMDLWVCKSVDWFRTNREPLQTGTRCPLLYFQVQGLEHILGHRCRGRIMACVLEKGVCPHWRSASSVLGPHAQAQPRPQGFSLKKWVGTFFKGKALGTRLAQAPRVNTAHALQKCQLIECQCNGSCNSVWEILAITLRDTIFPVPLVSLATLFFYRG